MLTRCMIIEDEPLARDILRTYISKIPSLALTAECSNAFEAVAAYNNLRPDIVFCDIQMPGLSGINFLKSLHQLPSIILTTAFVEYAVDGFDIGVKDYLVKPFSFERFLKALSRAMNPATINAEEEQPPGYEGKNDSLFFKTSQGFSQVLLNDILYIEALGNYLSIHHGKQHALVVKGKIFSVESTLDEKHFIRIHRSYIIAIGHIKTFSQNNITLSNGKTLPVGGYYKRSFLNAVYGTGIIHSQ